MSTRSAIVAVVFACLLAVYGGYRLVLAPQREERSALLTQLDAARSTLAQAEADVAAGKAATARRPALEADLIRLGAAVPRDLDQPSLVNQVDAAARRSGVSFAAVSLTGDGTPAAGEDSGTSAIPPGAVSGEDGLAEQPLEIRVRGTYFEIARFAHTIRDLVSPTSTDVAVRGRLLDVGSLTLEPRESRAVEINATFQVTSYLTLATPAPAAATDGPGAPTAPDASTATTTPPPLSTTENR